MELVGVVHAVTEILVGQQFPEDISPDRAPMPVLAGRPRDANR